jgi:hypothetical protein
MGKLFGFFSFAKFQWMLLALTSLAAIFFFVEAVRFLPVTGDNMYPESVGVFTAQRWAQGLPLYTDFFQPPYLLTAFTPLWYGLIAILAKAGFSDLDTLTLLGRFLSMTSLLAVCVIGFFWNRRIELPFAMALLTPTFYLSFPILIPWAVTARPDFLGLFFSVLAVFLVAFWPGATCLLFACLAAAMSFLTKHSYVAAPTAIVLWLLWSKRWKDTALFCSIWIVLVATTLLGFEIASGGMMSLNLSGNHAGHFSLRNIHQILVLLTTTAGSGFTIVLLSFGFFGLLGSWKRENPACLLILYFLTSLSVAIVGSGAAGANVNHYIEIAFASTLLLPNGMARLRGTWEQGAPIGALIFIVIVGLLLPALDMQRWRMAGEDPPENFKRLLPMIKNKRVLTDIPYLGARSLNPEFLDPVSYAYAEQLGFWSPKDIVKAIQGKEYDLAILHRKLDDPRWNETRYPTLGSKLRTSIAQNYKFCFELDSAYVYSPVSGVESGPRDMNCPSPAHIPATGKTILQ